MKVFEEPAWECLHFVNDDVVCASSGGIDLPGLNIGGDTQDITVPGGGIAVPGVPLN